jgi:hypothetical protein
MTWVLCSDTLEEKENWMNEIMKFLKVSSNTSSSGSSG